VLYVIVDQGHLVHYCRCNFGGAFSVIVRQVDLVSSCIKVRLVRQRMQNPTKSLWSVNALALCITKLEYEVRPQRRGLTTSQNSLHYCK
jgi:hypothetical protein